MKGILLAGGTGSRLYPLTKTTNKHLLPVGKLPMILHNIYKLKEAGITDICIVMGIEHAGRFVDLLGSGIEYGVNLTYKIQSEPNGIAGALGLTKDFVGNDRFVVILSDNIFTDSLKGKFNNMSFGSAKVFVKEVKDPERFGCPEYDDDQIINIEEKPSNPKSNDAVVGIYAFDRHVFGYLDKIAPSNRGELEITDVLNFYIENGTLKHARLDGFWSDAGTFETYFAVNEYFAEKEKLVDIKQ